jgi:hypothetical protein
MVELCEYWQKKLEIQAEELGIAAIYYGDQERIPKSPTVCIEPDIKDSPLYAAGRQTRPMFTIYFLIYHSEVRNVQSNRRDSDALAERIEDFLNSDPQMGGLVVHGYVSQSASGYSPKTDSLMRSNRLTFTAESRHQLPMSS